MDNVSNGSNFLGDKGLLLDSGCLKLLPLGLEVDLLLQEFSSILLGLLQLSNLLLHCVDIGANPIDSITGYPTLSAHHPTKKGSIVPERASL